MWSRVRGRTGDGTSYIWAAEQTRSSRMTIDVASMGLSAAVNVLRYSIRTSKWPSSRLFQLYWNLTLYTMESARRPAPHSRRIPLILPVIFPELSLAERLILTPRSNPQRLYAMSGGETLQSRMGLRDVPDEFREILVSLAPHQLACS